MMSTRDETADTRSSPRALVETGLVTLAAQRLGRPYRLDGIVVRGDHRGRELGFPTANLSFAPFAPVPADGVYAGRVLLTAGPQYNGRGRDNSRSRDNSGAAAALELLGLAAVSVGTNPTFDGRERRVEAHILDFDGDLYGAGIGVEFTARLRGMLRFDDIGALVDQMHHDVAQTRQTALRHR